MPDDLHITRQGPPRSGELIVTDEEKHLEDARWQEEREYTQIARHFFAMFLEMKREYEDGKLHPSREYTKELAQYRKLNEKLKEAVNEALRDARRFEESLAIAEEEKTSLQAKVNELIIENGRLAEKVSGLGVIRERESRTGYSFLEHLSEESRSEWEKLMKEIPRGN